MHSRQVPNLQLLLLCWRGEQSLFALMTSTGCIQNDTDMHLILEHNGWKSCAWRAQVAGRVDMLDGRVKQEQESSLRALEAILSESGHGKR